MTEINEAAAVAWFSEPTADWRPEMGDAENAARAALRW